MSVKATVLFDEGRNEIGRDDAPVGIGDLMFIMHMELGRIRMRDHLSEVARVAAHACA